MRVVWVDALLVMGRGLSVLMSNEQKAVSLAFNDRRLRLQVCICASLLMGVLV
ncbi:hypothetical protein D3C76_964500 [compost metagenome]